MKLTLPQRTVATDLHRFRVLRWGRRTGKTRLICEEIKGIALKKPTKTAYIANNYQQARDIAWELFKKELKAITIDTNEQRLEIKVHTLQGGESLIVLRGWESVENLRGQAFDFLCIDEVAQMRNFWVNWEEVLRPTLTDTRGIAVFASTPKGFNHFYDLCNLELTDKEWKTFHFTSYDNPHLPKDELDKAKETLPPDRFAQEYMASFQKTQGLVYKEFSRERHLYEEIPPIVNIWGQRKQTELYGGIDFGYRNPAAVLHIVFTGEKLFVDEEWYKTERTDAQIADYVKVCRFKAVFPDPENPGGIEELRTRGINVREVMKGKGSVEAGIQRIREMLLRGDLMINKKCVNLIHEFEMYAYDEDKGDRDEQEKPIKASDHACFVAGTLIETKRGFVHIDKVTTNDFVWTPFGFSRVLKSEKVGIEDVFDYGVFSCTSNHPILSTQGVAPIDTLRYNSLVCTQTQRQFTSIEYLIAGILTQRKEVKGFILDALLTRNSEARPDIYTEMFGSITKEKSPKDILSIIKMGTTTTLLPILKLLMEKSMLGIMIGETPKDNMNISQKFAGLLSNGTLLKQVENGTLSMENLLGKIGCPHLQSVLNAVENTILISLHEAGSVIKTAEPKHFGNAEVYNLATEDGMYFANGVLVSNCDALRYVVSTLLPVIQRTEYARGLPKVYRPPVLNKAR